MDVLNAGSGNDTITINASNITALAHHWCLWGYWHFYRRDDQWHILSRH
jgi:hypothetical protein